MNKLVPQSNPKFLPLIREKVPEISVGDVYFSKTHGFVKIGVMMYPFMISFEHDVGGDLAVEPEHTLDNLKMFRNTAAYIRLCGVYRKITFAPSWTFQDGRQGPAYLYVFSGERYVLCQ